MGGAEIAAGTAWSRRHTRSGARRFLGQGDSLDAAVARVAGLVERLPIATALQSDYYVAESRPAINASTIMDDDKDLYAGLIRLHVLHHAVEEGAVYGLWMIEELGRHGYRLSPGTLYPILHGLERKGYLRSTRARDGSKTRRTYEATPAGRKALARAKERVWELFGELFEPTQKKKAGKPRLTRSRTTS